jgi:hypothetical protein
MIKSSNYQYYITKESINPNNVFNYHYKKHNSKLYFIMKCE